MKQITAIVFLTIVSFFLVTFNCIADDYEWDGGAVSEIPETSYPDGEEYEEGDDVANWETGGYGSFDSEAYGPETEAEGTIGLYDHTGEFEISGNEYSSEVESFSTQSVGGEVTAIGEEVEGYLEGVAEQVTSFETFREVEWESGAKTEAFAAGGEYGTVGFELETEGTESLEISGEGVITGESVGYINNAQLDEDGVYGYASEAYSRVENSGEASYTMDGTGEGSAYINGEGIAAAGSYANHQFEDGVTAIAATYGEAEFEYSVTAGCGEGCVSGTVAGEGSAVSEGYSQVWQEGTGTYAESWHRSSSSTGSPTFSLSEGVVGGVTASGSSESDDE
jgi:hypothetical protein